MTLFDKTAQRAAVAITAAAALIGPHLEAAQFSERPETAAGLVHRDQRETYYSLGAFVEKYANASGSQREVILYNAVQQPDYLIRDCIRAGSRVLVDAYLDAHAKDNAAGPEAVKALYRALGNRAAPIAEALLEQVSVEDVRDLLLANPRFTASIAARELATADNQKYYNGDKLVWLIGQTGPEGQVAIPVLTKLIEQHSESTEYPHRQLTKDCFRALSDIKASSPEVLELGARLLSHPVYGPSAAEFLGGIGTQGIDAAAHVISVEPNLAAKQRAIAALEHMGPSGVQVLIACLEQPGTRADALKVITALGPEAVHASGALENLSQRSGSSLSAAEKRQVNQALDAVRGSNHALGSDQKTVELAEKLLERGRASRGQFVMYPESALETAYCWATGRAQSAAQLWKYPEGGYTVARLHRTSFLGSSYSTHLDSNGNVNSYTETLGDGRWIGASYSGLTAREEQAKVNEFLLKVDERGGLMTDVTGKQIISWGSLVALAALTEVARRRWLLSSAAPASAEEDVGKAEA